MPANWNEPTLVSPYAQFLDNLNFKIYDCASMFGTDGATNIPGGAIRFERTQNVFQEYYQGAWYTKVIGVAGGGTGSTTPGGIITNLGLGTMALQNANNVNISGGLASSLNGYGIHNMNAAALEFGILQDKVFPPILPALNGAYLFNLNAAALAFGTIDPARIGTGGTGTGTRFLADDNTWKVIDMKVNVKVQLILITLLAGTNKQTVGIVDPVPDTAKAFILPLGGMTRAGDLRAGTIPLKVYFSDQTGNIKTGTGQAEWITLEAAGFTDDTLTYEHAFQVVSYT